MFCYLTISSFFIEDLQQFVTNRVEFITLFYLRVSVALSSGTSECDIDYSDHLKAHSQPGAVNNIAITPDYCRP